MLEGLRPAHVKLIGVYWVRFSVRTGGGLMTLLVVVLTGLCVAAAFIAPVEALMKESPELGHSEEETADYLDRLARSDQFVDVVNWVTGDKEQAAYLLRDQPALLSVIFVLLLMLFPFVAALAGFNQTAGEIGNHGLRFLLLRTERPNVFVGRFLGTLAFTAASTGVMFAVLLLYITLKFSIYDAGSLLAWGGQGFLAALFICLPHIALCAWISGLMDSPFGALAICQLLVGFPILFLNLIDWTAGGDQSWLLRLLPWGWKYDLISGDLGTRLLAYGVMTLFALGFLALGVRAFQKRDL